MIREWQWDTIRYNSLGEGIRYFSDISGDQRVILADGSMSLRTGRYTNADRHLAAHQKPLILIRLSDYSAAAMRDGDVRIWDIILPVW